MWAIRGEDFDGRPFTVSWDGKLSGDGPLHDRLQVLAGESFPVTPTGPYVTLDLTDEASVAVAVLASSTAVGRTVDGEPPLPVPALPDGAVG